ncbi:MAG TPA: CHAD domain-containing protein [Candidatus Elarobacter sp.]
MTPRATFALETVSLGRTSTVGDLARAALAGALTQLLRSDVLLRLAPDADAVHDARVAVRRLRSDLRAFRPVLDAAWARDLRERMRWLQDGFSAARDADVLLESLRRRAGELHDDERSGVDDALSPLREERRAAYDRMGAMLDDARYAALLNDLIEAVNRPCFTEGSGAPAREAIGTILCGAWSALRKRVRERSRPATDRELHGIRIAAKRMRYAAEAVAPLAGRRTRALAHAAESLQTVLGDQHDAVVARERVRALAADARRAFVAGALAALEHLAARDGRRAWRRSWRKVKTAKRAAL